MIIEQNIEIIQKIARIIKCHETAAKLLVNRGIKTPEDAFAFLNPSLQHLKNPFSLKDMKKAAARIYTALCNKEKILIFGDFDADGVTATAVLNEFLTYVQADVSWYIPHRIREGYSLKPYHIKMALEQKCDLLITVDCGSDSYKAVKDAVKEDIDVIITDHHEIADIKPPAFAIINPKQKDCESGLEYLAGVGVAFYLTAALRSYLREQGFWEQEISEPNLIEYTDLFAIGTIADMVPLKAENRILSKAGISIIRKSKRAGLNELIKVSGLEQRYIDGGDISFKIAPRINAAGRISHSRICVDLLTEKSRVKAEQTAFILEELNKKRQDQERWIIEDIEKKISTNLNILKRTSIVMDNKEWHQGVLGIAASKIAKKYFRPVVLISTSVPSGAAGSCRSVGNINIHQALSNCSHLLENFGGHTMAAGISIKPENIEKFSECFENEISKAVLSDNYNADSEIIIDSYLDFDQITQELVDDIEKLKPFGIGNPEPLFCCKNVKVISSFMIASKHRKMVLAQYKENGETKYGKDNNVNTITVSAMQFNLPLPAYESESVVLPEYFKEILFRIKKSRISVNNMPSIIIEDR